MKNDVPQDLAYNFCMDNSILTSIDSLREHIKTAIDNYKR